VEGASAVERKQLLRLVIKQVMSIRGLRAAESGSELYGRPAPSANTRSGAM
jgi:hypothetical protein